MNWGELGKAVAKMTPAERKQPVTFVEPYDDGAVAYKGLSLAKAQDDITVDDEDRFTFKIRVDFRDTDDGKVYGSEEYLVEGDADIPVEELARAEKVAVKEALRLSEGSELDDPRIDHTRETEVVEVLHGTGIPVRKGEFLLE